MQCTRPYTVRISPLGEFENVKYIHYPCGKCLACRINKRREWTSRLMHEQIYSKSSWFVTLTYDEEHVPFDDNGNMAVSVRDVQLFHKRLRKRFFDCRIRFFVNSEYGPEGGRPHYHGIYFNLPDEILRGSKRLYRNGSISFTSPVLESIWQNGDVEIGEAAQERCGYCAKYFIDRKEIDPLLQPNFNLMSRRPGIGFQYSQDVKEKVRFNDLHAVLSPNTGKYVALPRYYRSKIYSDDERAEQFEEYKQNYQVSKELQDSLFNPDIVESNQLRSITFKGKKQKLK